MSIVGTILVGFIVGLIARAVKPGDDRMGIIMTTLLGIAGSVVARYAGRPWACTARATWPAGSPR